MDNQEHTLAIVGMSCRLPGARSISEYWKNLCNGIESITFFSHEDLLAKGVPPEVWQDPAYVRAHGAIQDPYAFDAAFFGVSRNEARVIDPQQRVLLECAWSALEDAGCDPGRFRGSIGVFAGSGRSNHERRVRADQELLSEVGSEIIAICNSRDFLSTRISHKLGLRGPSMTVLTACSTSLVAIHLACQSLLNHECDLALAGGSTIEADPVGYYYQEGGKSSPDGHCRAFDQLNAGTVPASGVGMVALKRLTDALRDGDPIHALVLGSAINNDGADKVGFTAPSIQGQAQCIAEALALADIDASTVQYVEAHGTATPLGDPIELAALNEVFQRAARQNGKCALGAVKTNIGHVDAAAGVAGFIKVALALENKYLPPTLHFERPNPETDLEHSPFYLNTVLRPWNRSEFPRRAGVSSFGMGGTNAHVVLGEAPDPPRSNTSTRPQVIVLSAKNEQALTRMRANVATHLADHPNISLEDAAYTLQEGRAVHRYRWAAVASDTAAAPSIVMASPGHQRAFRKSVERLSAGFLFPGGGTQYSGMARELYANLRYFREQVDQCIEPTVAQLGIDLRTLLFPAAGIEQAALAQLEQIQYALPALFAVEYALAQTWISWGIKPVAMLGHSLGEYVAAAIAGVFSREAAMRLVMTRASLMQSLPAGTMLAVPLAEEELLPLLTPEVAIAAVNGKSNCVVSGPPAPVAQIQSFLDGQGVITRRLHVSHASHSPEMEPILDAFEMEVRNSWPTAPKIPFVSNLTGDWITDDQATSPHYWVRHLRETVRFSDGLRRIREQSDCALLEVGPGETLGTFARREFSGNSNTVIVKSLPAHNQPESSEITMLEAVGSLWTAGMEIDWSRVRGGEMRTKIRLPCYPFDRTEYRVTRKPYTVPTPTSIPEPPMMTSSPEIPQVAERRSHVSDRVAMIFARLIGIEAQNLEADRTFLELGADSLLLMQASRSIESEFGVRVPFRLLLTTLATIDALAVHLDHEIPASVDLIPITSGKKLQNHMATSDHASPPVATAITTEPTKERADSQESQNALTLEGIIAQQLSLMQSQVELLRNGARLDHNFKMAESPSARYNVPAATNLSPAIVESVTHGPHRPIHETLRQGGSYSQQQQEYFNELVGRYTSRTRRSKQYASDHRPMLADNRAALGFRMATKELVYPIVGTRSSGSRIWDLDDNEYIDFTSGFGVHFFGHRPQFIVEAVQAQLERGFHLGPQSDLAGPAARLFCELTGKQRVTFCNTGSEAVMTAIRIARAATGRDRIVLFKGSYHGCFDGVLARAAGADRGQPKSQPIAPGTPQGMVEDVVVLPYGSVESLSYIDANAEKLAAVLVEPIQSRDIELHPKEFLQRVREITTRAGTVLLFDEMITGFRLGPHGAQGFFGIEADLATYGKVIGGGFPIGLVAGRADLMNAIDGGQWHFGDDSFPVADQTFFAGTFCKHPLAMAAMYAVLKHLKGRDLSFYDELNSRTSRLVAKLRAVATREDIPMRIPSCGSIFHFKVDSQEAFAPLLFSHMLLRGMYIWEGRGCFLSTAHTDQECDRLVDALSESIDALRKGGFLPFDTRDTVFTAGSSPEREIANNVLSFPLTPSQRQIWVHTQLSTDASLAYNEQFLCRLHGQLDLEALTVAIDDIIKAHEGLRTVFDSSGEQQFILPSLLFKLSFHDSRPAQMSSSIWLEAAREPFDFVTGPLFRVHVYRIAPDEHLLQIIFHHLAIDGIAISLLLRDLETAYVARLAGNTPQLPKAMQLSTYLGLREERSKICASQEVDWLRRFEGVKPLDLPTDRPRRPVPKASAAPVRRKLDADTTAQLKAFGRQKGLTLFMSLLGSLLMTLHRLSDQDDIVVGIPYSGRPFQNSDSLIAQCVDVLPIRSQVSGDQSLQSILQMVRDSLLYAYEHEEFTYAHLLEKLRMPRKSGQTPLISLAFNLEPARISTGSATHRFADLDKQEMDSISGALAKMDIQVDASESASELYLTCLYSTELFDTETIDRLVATWMQVLTYMTNEPESFLSNLPVSGRVNRIALPAPDMTSSQERFVAPRTPLEEVLATSWTEVLQVPRVGATDDFFELGGHSLLATRLVTRLRDILGIQMPVGTLFEHPTVASLATWVEEIRRSARPALAAISAAPRTSPLPLSFGQERLWFLDQMQPGDSSYNAVFGVRLNGLIAVDALERALGEIVKRHEALRTTFEEVNGAPAQIVTPFTGFSLGVEDLTSTPTEEREAAARLRMREEAARPFNLAFAPLFRGSLLRLDADEHILVLCAHHIVCDAWSMSVLSTELSSIYSSFLDGRESPLPPLSLQYADYAVWQHEQVSRPDFAEQLVWWKDQLAGAPDLLPLPTDSPRPAIQSNSGAVEPIRLSSEVLARLEALSRKEGATLYMVLLCAWQMVLSLHCGTEDVVVGTTTAGRTRQQLEPLIGLFMSTLVLRGDLSGNPSFREMLQRVRAVTLGAFDHQDIPFERLVAELRPNRSLSYSPLFQVLFELQDAGKANAGLLGLQSRSTPIDSLIAKFDLSISITATPKGLSGGLTYRTELFEPQTIKCILKHFTQTVEHLSLNPEVRLSDLAILKGPELELVVREWNRTKDASCSFERCVHELFDQQAAETPDAIAVTHGTASITYRELEERSTQLAAELYRMGVRPEVKVALFLERSIDLLVAIFGVLKAGGAYVPIDPMYPSERIAYILADSQARVLLTQENLRNIVPPIDKLEIFSLDRTFDLIITKDAAPTISGVTAENLCYVIYTSGSTGRPKGVAMHHRGVCNYIAWGVEAYGAAHGNGAPVFTSMAVDLTITNLLPLFTGKPVHLLPEENPVEALAETLRKKPDFGLIKITPIHLDLLGSLLAPEEMRGIARTLVIGADFLLGETTILWQDHAHDLRLINEYGPTETVVGCSAYTLPNNRHRAGPVPVGRPIQNLRFYVLDAQMRPVMPGLRGELYIGGAGVARGYLGRPALTAERFVPDKFSGSGERMYRTGDYARWTPDGNLMILGRTDNQVKIRGFRVELGEVESVLRRHPNVSACLVVLREDSPGDRRLVAYFVGEADVADLREHLRRSLPDYMLPSAFVPLGSLPHTPTGKIDSRTLPPPNYNATATEFVPPSTPVEARIASIWAEVMKLDRIGRHDDFFSLGGHSLLAVRTVSRLRKALGVEVAIRDLFTHPELADLARVLESAAHAELPPISVAQRTEQIPLSFAQQRLWFLAQFEGVSRAYHIPFGLRLKGHLDSTALRRALDRIMARHEALRTNFAFLDGETIQRISAIKDSRFALSEVDLRECNNAVEELTRLSVLEAETSFDLESSPLIRGRLVRLADNEHALLLTMHHIVSDDWSMGLFKNELCALYSAFLHDEDDPLPKLDIQYADYAIWQRRWIEGETLQRQAAYWKTTLDGAPALLEIPTDIPRPALQEFDGAFAKLTLDQQLTENLKALSKKHGTTLFMTLLAGWATLLARLSGQQDIVIGTPTANRARTELENLIGFFVNTLAIRIDLSNSPSVSDLIHQVRSRVLDAQLHQDIPFEQVVDLAQPERSLAHGPLFQVMFAWHAATTDKFELSGIELEALRLSPHRVAKFDLTLHLGQVGDTIAGGVEYATSLFKEATVGRYLCYFSILLEAMVSDDSQVIDKLPILSDSERQLLLYEWNDTGTFYPKDKCVHDFFEEQVEKTPGAVAVVFGDESLSYIELNRRTNRLANYLIELGVKPDNRVAICAERSLDMVVGLIAILKAGGAYVPIDPDYPLERLSFIIEDAQPVALLIQNQLRDLFSDAVGTLPILDLDAATAVWLRHPHDNIGSHAIGLTPQHLAYVIYTSGSTGLPKGVMVQHSNVTRLFTATEQWFHFADDDVWTLFHSYAFDFSVWEIWGALLHGGRLIVVPKSITRSPEEFYTLICDEKVTVLSQTPSAFQQLVSAQANDANPHQLRWVIFGGEALNTTTLKPWYDRAENKHTWMINMYGITETTVHATYRALEPIDTRSARSPIGRRLPDLRIYILDAHGNPVPIGVTGELNIGGEGVARGYLNRPELTDERFIPDPFAGEPGARMYRTGDLGRYLPDGDIEYLGRSDFQVKIRGYRIELGEIETRLMEHADVREAVVVALEYAPGDNRLVAYYTAKTDVEEQANEPRNSAFGAEQLRSHLSGLLPKYMLPAAYVRMKSLPLTPNGKLDRKALPAPESKAYSTSGYEPPVSESEIKLAEIWADVLGIENVGRNDNFFALGGESILAMQVVSRARRANLKLTPRQVFEHQTIGELAPVVEQSGQQSAARTETTANGFVPLTPIQVRFFEQQYPLPSHMNQSTLWSVDASINDSTLESALSVVFAHHDALRLRFRKTASGWEQWHGTTPGIRLEWMDLSALSSAEQERVQREIADQKQASLDLERGPLGRAIVFDCDTRGRLLLLILHHLLVDVVSWNILRQDMERACTQASTGAPIDLGEKSTSFHEWSKALRSYASTERLRAEVPFWRDQGMEGVGLLSTSSPEGSDDESAGELRFRMSANETHALLQKIPSAHGAQINEALLWALAETISEWTATPRVRFALEGHGREDIIPGFDLTDTVGWFTSIFPVVLDTSRSSSTDPTARLKLVAEQLRAVPSRGIGYGILRYLSPDDSLRYALSSHPEPQIVFNYIGQVDQRGHAGPIRFAYGYHGRERASINREPYDIELNCAVAAGELHWNWTFRTDVHARETIQSLNDTCVRHLRELIESPEIAIPETASSTTFRLANLEQSDLRIALDGAKDVEDLYPLSPMQEGMLFHTLSDAETQPYQVENAYRLTGPLDIALFRRAWSKVAARHAVLRTSFVWEGLKRPVQRVHKSADILWHVETGLELSQGEQERHVDKFSANDRDRGFDLRQAPLMRCALLQTNEDEHWFVWSHHHLLMDGWSCARVLSEVFRVYDGWKSGQPVELPSVRPYASYIAWLQQQSQERAEKYWRNALAGFALPPRLGLDTFSGPASEWRAQRTVRLSADLTRQLEYTARQYTATLNTLLLGVWGILISHYTGQDDIVVGATVSGRQAELDGIEEMVGLFINTLPIRMRLAGRMQFNTWIETLQHTQVEAREYEYAPLMWVQRWSEIPRGAQLFEAHFVFENYPVERIVPSNSNAAARLRLTGVRGMEWNHYPLSLQAAPGNELSLTLSYDEARFSAASVERMVEQLESLLRQVAADPSMRLSAISLLSATEREQVITSWNRTARAFPTDLGIHDLFEAQARSTPDAAAVISGGQALSYGDLDRRTNQMAHYLRELGVGPEVRVGVCLDRTPELMIALLAILKAGGAYVPLDRQYPSERLGYMLEDSAVPVLLIQEKLTEMIPIPEGVRVVRMDAAETLATVSRQPEEAPASGITPENLCYVIYTSGSTGRPKGVMVNHRSVVNRLLWMQDLFTLDWNDAVLQKTPFSFDVSVWELFLPLLTGSKLVIAEPEGHKDPAYLCEAVRDNSITVLHFVPSMMQVFLEHADSANCQTVTDIVCSGEALPASLVRKVRERLPHVTLHNLYGPTEATVDVTSWSCTGDVSSGTIPIGKPIANTQIYILNEHGEPVPPEVTGELYIGGEGVARGYLGRPELTAEKFLPDPFSSKPGARMYRTGDLSRWLSDGNIEFLGRNDFQVKIRGFRIELGEIEARLGEYSGIREVAVIARDNASGEKSLICYYVPDQSTFAESAGLDTRRLRSYLALFLPEYMIPAAYIRLDSLPLTPSGKLDRKALPLPENTDTSHSYIAPRTAVEEALSKIWSDVLEVERIGICADFFALGGHSLSIMRLIALVRSAFGIQLSIRTIFAKPILENLAAEIEQEIYAEIEAISDTELVNLISPDERIAG